MNDLTLWALADLEAVVEVLETVDDRNRRDCDYHLDLQDWENLQTYHQQTDFQSNFQVLACKSADKDWQHGKGFECMESLEVVMARGRFEEAVECLDEAKTADQ